jgi:nitric oxide synthase-interacting protein
MPRHSKNNCARPVFTAWEKANTHEWGTSSRRLTADSMKPFQGCSLCLHDAVVPLSDLQGHLYCKQCIFEYLLDQKKQYKQKKKDYAAYKAKLEEIEKSKEMQKNHEEMKVFEARQLGEVTDKDRREAAVKPLHWDKNMKSFWLPSQSPEGVLERVEKPSKITRSPFGHPFSLKELVTLNLTEEKKIRKKEKEPQKDDKNIDEKGGETEKDKMDVNARESKSFICPVCLKSLNQVPAIFAVKTSGSVFCANCFNSVLKKDMIDPVTNTKFTQEDLIALEAEGTSFSSRTKERSEATSSSIPAPRFG